MPNNLGVRKRHLLLVVLVGIVVLAACTAPSAAQPPAASPTSVVAPTSAASPTSVAAATPAQQVSGGDPARGQAAITTYGCGSCHVIPGVAGATGTVGPSLATFGSSKDIADDGPNTPDNLIKFLQNPSSVKPGTTMPNLGVTEPDARDIAAYLYTLK